MSTDNGYKAEIESTFAGFWRYNVAVTCGLFSEDGRQVGYAAAEDTIAPAGSNLAERPSGVAERRRITVSTADCHHLRMYIYLIPHTLPASDKVLECKPFEISIKISHGGRTILHEQRRINQWSGASIEITVPQ